MVIRSCGVSIQCLIDAKFGKVSSFVWTDLTREPHAQTPSRTPTFEVQAWDPIWSFIKLIFSFLSTCCIHLSYASSWFHMVGWMPLEGRCLICLCVRVTTYSLPRMIVTFPPLKLVIVIDDFLEDTITPWIVAISTPFCVGCCLWCQYSCKSTLNNLIPLGFLIFLHLLDVLLGYCCECVILRGLLVNKLLCASAIILYFG